MNFIKQISIMYHNKSFKNNNSFLQKVCQAAKAANIFFNNNNI